MDSSLLHDMKKYHPRSWKEFHQHKERCIFCSLYENLELGKKMGLYRSEINTEIISRFRLESTENLFYSEIFSDKKYHIKDLQLEIFDHFVYGIVTEKGKKLFETYKRDIN